MKSEKNSGDKRVKRTRHLIIEAFYDLLSKKKYSQITVQDIIDSADIGRSTFYLHFETKDALLDELCENIFVHVFSQDPLSDDCLPYTNRNDLFGYISHILYHIQDDRSAMRPLFLYDDSLTFINDFASNFSKNLLSIVEFKNEDGISIEFLRNHLTESFLYTVIWWLKNAKEKTPEEIAKCYLYSIQSLIIE